MTFLIIEDDPAISRLIQTVVESTGHLCLSAFTTQEADLALATIPVDAMTLDLVLPNSEPVGWLEEIALTRPELAENTIVVTGSIPDRNLEERIRKCGAGMLLKPFTLKQLDAMIRDRIVQGDQVGGKARNRDSGTKQADAAAGRETEESAEG